MNVQIQRMYRFETNRPLKAFADIVIDDCLLIKGVRVMKGSKGLFVSMPREMAKDNKWYDIIRCLTKEASDQISKCILEAYGDGDPETEPEPKPKTFDQEIIDKAKELGGQ